MAPILVPSGRKPSLSLRRQVPAAHALETRVWGSCLCGPRAGPGAHGAEPPEPSPSSCFPRRFSVTTPRCPPSRAPLPPRASPRAPRRAPRPRPRPRPRPPDADGRAVPAPSRGHLERRFWATRQEPSLAPVALGPRGDPQARPQPAPPRCRAQLPDDSSPRRIHTLDESDRTRGLAGRSPGGLRGVGTPPPDHYEDIGRSCVPAAQRGTFRESRAAAPAC